MGDDRAQVVDFNYPYYFSPVTFVTKSPKIINDSKLMLIIFTKQLWIAIIISILILILFVKIFKIYDKLYEFFFSTVKQSIVLI